MLNINDYIEMTKENFIDKANYEEWCPDQFELHCKECDGNEEMEECVKCWNTALENIDFFNPMMAFQNNEMSVLDDLTIVEGQYQQLDAGRKDLKNKLMVLMEQYGIDKFENENIRITYIKGVTGTTFDSAKFKKEHADLHAAYQKPSLRAASIRFKVK